jgi:hypothetical protein
MPQYGIIWTFQPAERDELQKVLDKFDGGFIVDDSTSSHLVAVVEADTSSEALKTSLNIIRDSGAIAVDGYTQRVTAGVEQGNELQWWREFLQTVKII